MKRDQFSICFTALMCHITLILACGGDGGGDGQSDNYTVGGEVRGMKGSVVLQCNGTDDLTVTGDGRFTFATAIKNKETYNITVLTDPSEQTCAVTNGNGTVSGDNVTDVDVLCTFTSIARVSVDSSGSESNGDNIYPSISSNGRYIAFQTDASNLVAGDIGGWDDIFVHDRITDQTIRVSVDSSGNEGNNDSSLASINSDGRYIAFYSHATNLVSPDTNGVQDIFVHDRQTGATTRVSVDSSGAQGNAYSTDPSISNDGRYISFTSNASNLVTGDTNGTSDIFVHDRQTGETTRVSVDSTGIEADSASLFSSLSGNGRFVAFYSYSTNLVSGDTNGFQDIFVHDRQSGQTTRASVDSSGTQGNDYSTLPAISDDGRYVTFQSLASNLVPGDTNSSWDIFVHDLQTGETTRVSVNSSNNEGNAHSYSTSINSDGRYVSFTSRASDLVTGDTNGIDDIFVHDRQTGLTTRLSKDSSSNQGNGDCEHSSINGDGRYVAFESDASNLVTGDTNLLTDTFVAPVK